jgi:hypothetical protein
MSKEKPKLIIVGDDDLGRSVASHLIKDYEVVLVDDMKPIKSLEMSDYKAPKKFDLPMIGLKDNFFSNGKSKRNIRRERERKNKKKK